MLNVIIGRSYTAVTYLLQCCCTAVITVFTPLLHCCYAAVALLSHFAYTVVTLPLHCCYTHIAGYFSKKCWVGVQSQRLSSRWLEWYYTPLSSHYCTHHTDTLFSFTLLLHIVLWLLLCYYTVVTLSSVTRIWDHCNTFITGVDCRRTRGQWRHPLESHHCYPYNIITKSTVTTLQQKKVSNFLSKMYLSQLTTSNINPTVIGVDCCHTRGQWRHPLDQPSSLLL
jgi:hypothetical protein